MTKCACCGVRAADTTYDAPKPARSLQGWPVSSACLAEHRDVEMAHRMWERANKLNPGTFKGHNRP